jgi:hypothetical protein
VAVGQREGRGRAIELVVVGAVDIASQPGGVSLQGGEPLYLTHRTSIAWEAWRTTVNPTADAPFYLVTSKDPAVTSNPNRFVFNDPAHGALVTVNDEMADAVASTKETHPENGDVLEIAAAPRARSCSPTRIACSSPASRAIHIASGTRCSAATARSRGSTTR